MIKKIFIIIICFFYYGQSYTQEPVSKGIIIKFKEGVDYKIDYTKSIFITGDSRLYQAFNNLRIKKIISFIS